MTIQKKNQAILTLWVSSMVRWRVFPRKLNFQFLIIWLAPGVKKRNKTERNGINGKYLRKWETKRNVTKFKETKLKRKNNSVSEKKITKNVEIFFLHAVQYSFLGIWVTKFESNPNKPNLAWPPKRIKLTLLGSTAQPLWPFHHQKISFLSL
jgi:hypothetical protein